MIEATGPEAIPVWERLAQLERAAALQGGDMRHWQSLLDASVSLGDDDLALLAAQRLAALAPHDPGRQAQLADRLSEAGNVREAYAITNRLFQDAPRHPSLPLVVGMQLGRLGREEEALRALRLAVRRAPHSVLAWENLASVRKFQAGDAEFTELERLAKASQDRPEMAGFAYAFAKACDDVGDVERAYEWFVRAARRVLGGRVPRLDSLFAEAGDVLEAFPPEFFATSPRSEHVERPVVVLGCPRSGTTLVEQIICASPEARSGGELKMLRLACLGFSPPSMSRVAQFLQAQGGAAAAWQRVAATYVDRLRRRFGTADGVVDKGLVNHLYVGALALALPRARIIYVKRNPMDVAWSCFRRRFHDGLRWSYDYESIAAFLRVYTDIMAHWERVLPGRVLRVGFERLVANPDEETARLFNHVGLERPADWRSFHQRKGAVLTASQQQVRRPLNTDGVRAWRRYERFLTPLQDALRRHGLTPDDAG